MGQTKDDAEALHEGIPPWAEARIWKWIGGALTYTSTGGQIQWNTAWLEEFDNLSRSTEPLASRAAHAGQLQAAVASTGDPDDLTLRLIDYLVWRLTQTFGSYLGNINKANERIDYLEVFLMQAGSAWTVGTREGHPGLERRVPEAVQAAADDAMNAPGHAGPRLAEAWHAVYGVSPNPAHAYAMAVKAVEDATIPAVVPKQGGATLGHVIGQLARDGDWGLPLSREDPDAPTSETIVRMLKALWKGRHDRHGGVANAPKSVSQEEAETAVMLAVPLVQWFTSGAAARR